MAQTECCSSCRHSISYEKDSPLVCRLRKLKVHQELAAFVFCHHWTKQSPSLPELDPNHSHIARQLDFERTLSIRDT